MKLRSDQGAGVFALIMIIVNVLSLTSVNQIATLFLTVLSIVWVAIKLGNSVLERKKLKKKE